MPQIFAAGAVNTTALLVPDLYVQITPPGNLLLNGVPTNVLGVVGTAQWGPVGAPVIAATMADGAAAFGNMQPRKYDLLTAMAAAVLQGANNFRLVRVTDGTDVAASIAVQATCLTLTGKYSGSLGNKVAVDIGPGSAASTFRAVVRLPGFAAEVFDNIGAGLAGNALWVAIAAAINNGQGGIRGPSQIVTASAGAGTTAPATATYALAGGTDGATTITSTVLVGVDTVPRKGMYALRGTGASVAFLADADDSTQWTLQLAFGLSEGVYMIGTGPAGDTIANAVSTKATAGIDSYAFKLLFGDWVYFNDTVNAQQRLISPQGFVAGKLAALSPEQSSLNKPLFGIVGTQKTLAQSTYSQAELQTLVQAGIDLIANPVPGGSYFGARFGHNSSSNPVTNGDNYTRLTNYIASTVAAGMGIFVGKLQTPDSRRQAKGMLDAFLTAMAAAGQIGTADGSQSFQVTLDNSNNTASQAALGYMRADVRVTYLSVIEKFLVNLEGGQSVTVTRLSVGPNN